jgi:hypothetical protein
LEGKRKGQADRRKKPGRKTHPQRPREPRHSWGTQNAKKLLPKNVLKTIERFNDERVSEIMLNKVNYSHYKRKKPENVKLASEKAGCNDNAITSLTQLNIY